MTEEEVLLKLYRKYSKDEEVKLLLSDVRLKIGEQTSYIQELEDKLIEVPKLNELIKSLKKENSDLRSGETIKKMQKRINEKDKKIKEQQQTINRLVTKIGSITR